MKKNNLFKQPTSKCFYHITDIYVGLNCVSKNENDIH